MIYKAIQITSKYFNTWCSQHLKHHTTLTITMLRAITQRTGSAFLSINQRNLQGQWPKQIHARHFVDQEEKQAKCQQYLLNY